MNLGVVLVYWFIFGSFANISVTVLDRTDFASCCPRLSIATPWGGDGVETGVKLKIGKERRNLN